MVQTRIYYQKQILASVHVDLCTSTITKRLRKVVRTPTQGTFPFLALLKLVGWGQDTLLYWKPVWSALTLAHWVHSLFFHHFPWNKYPQCQTVVCHEKCVRWVGSKVSYVRAIFCACSPPLLWGCGCPLTGVSHANGPGQPGNGWKSKYTHTGCWRGCVLTAGSQAQFHTDQSDVAAGYKIQSKTDQSDAGDLRRCTVHNTPTWIAVVLNNDNRSV